MTPERLALFTQFGEPAVMYEVHANHVLGGTFTYVLYQESAINVDWMLIPQSLAQLEQPARVLFSHTELPMGRAEEPSSREECAEWASMQVGFFWMIAASNVQNFLHGDLVQYQTLLRWLAHELRNEGYSWRESAPGPLSFTSGSPAERWDSVRDASL